MSIIIIIEIYKKSKLLNKLIIAVTNNNNSGSNNAMGNAGNPHFQQIKNSTPLEGYHYMDETSGHIIYQPNDPL